jgi:hypothetical protein
MLKAVDSASGADVSGSDFGSSLQDASNSKPNPTKMANGTRISITPVDELSQNGVVVTRLG